MPFWRLELTGFFGTNVSRALPLVRFFPFARRASPKDVTLAELGSANDAALTGKRASIKGPVVALAMGLCLVNAQAQQSANADLDSCINSEKLSLTVKGAAAGAAAGLLGSLLSGNKKDTGKVVLISATAGGALGYATAYYKAAGTCIQANPAWMPESNIQRNSNYRAVVSEFKYKPEKGDLNVVRPLQIPSTVKPGESADVKAKFVVLTPEGGEAKVKIARKLFASVEGKEEEVPFFGNPGEDRVVENGELIDTFKLPVDKEVPVGAKLRVEYGVSLRGAQFVSQSGTVEVK